MQRRFQNPDCDIQKQNVIRYVDIVIKWIPALILIAALMSVLLMVKAGEMEGVIKDFKIPLLSAENTPSGFISGKTAEFVDENIIEITKAYAVFTTPLSVKRKWALKCGQCSYNRKDSSVSTKDPAYLESKGIQIEGDGLDWQSDWNCLVFRKNVMVTIDKDKFQAVKSTQGKE
ncbi:MAG: hypothetical protein JW774_11700 [Candidatus Aureabacteria bacterium]|nr:hypothetical protein [Candidatus Auribacterota bacterium]